MLSVTCDNASNNNVMVDKLVALVPEFAGEASHTQCFLHTMNLVAKSLICEFDVLKKDTEWAWDMNAAEDDGLVELSADIEREDREMVAQYNEGVLEDDLQDNNEGWVNEVALLPEAQAAELRTNIRPVKLVLLKVR